MQWNETMVAIVPQYDRPETNLLALIDLASEFSDTWFINVLTHSGVRKRSVFGGKNACKGKKKAKVIPQ